MDVKSVMTPNPKVCTPETPLCEVARMMRDNDVGEIPVVDSEASKKPVGVVTDRDIVVRAIVDGRYPAEVVARECMTSPPATLSEDADVVECAELMTERQIRRVLIVDKDSKICGVVALSDLEKLNAPDIEEKVMRSVSTPH